MLSLSFRPAATRFSFSHILRSSACRASWFGWLGFFGGLLFISPPAWSTPLFVRVIPAQSEMTFVNKQMGTPVIGRFRQFDAQLKFDPQQPETGQVRLNIAVDSVSLGLAESEAELKKKEWFDSAHYPQATFVSTAIRSRGTNLYDVYGKLTIKGITKDVIVPLTLTYQKDAQPAAALASGQVTIKRLAYGIGAGEWGDPSIVADDVEVRFKLHLTAAAH